MKQQDEISSALGAGLTLRHARWEDADAVAQLMFDVCAADGDSTVAASVEDVRSFWKDNRFNLETDAWVVETVDGKIVGYEEYFNRHEHASLSGDGYVHPNYQDRGIGTALLHVLETRARSEVEKAAADARVYIRNGMSISDTRARQMHENEGYSPIRFSWRMEIQLEEPPPLPNLPSDVEIRPFLTEEHARIVHEATEEAFLDHWGFAPISFENWRSHLLEREDFDPSLFFIAWEGGEVAGASLCRNRPGIGWVSVLGVRRPWRKKGLGLALLYRSFGEFYARGMKTIGLGVDASSPTGATRLYERAGMRVASEYVIYEKELRAGR